MKTLIVANPRAQNGRVGKRWDQHQREIVAVLGSAQGALTSAPGDATARVRRAIDDGFERIVVIGGDGTINEAVNGFFADDGSPVGTDVSLVYLPVGTGGDFARSVGLSGVATSTVLQRATARPIDVGRAMLTGHDGREVTKHFINISSFGSSGVIVEKVNRTSKRWGGKVSFAIGTVRGLLSYSNKRVRLRIDDEFEEEMKINTVAVANGRFFGGSMMVAPNAVVDDGQFDIVVLGDLGLVQFAAYSRQLYAGTHLELPHVRAFRGKVVTATPLDGEVLIDLDGEQPGKLPVRYQVLPKALQLVAPWDSAVASGV